MTISEFLITLAGATAGVATYDLIKAKLQKRRRQRPLWQLELVHPYTGMARDLGTYRGTYADAGRVLNDRIAQITWASGGTPPFGMKRIRHIDD